MHVSKPAPIAVQRPSETLPLTGLFLLFAAVWLAYDSIATIGKSLHPDMIEAYTWGREFQLGYNQHPPFWAWITGAWFLIFPRTNWAFYLLAVLNATIGLAGAWRLLGLFSTGWQRRAAMVLLLCTPFYTFKAYLYNANSIYLSLWPWTAYAFVRAYDTRRHTEAVAFGAMVGLCLLSKYYAVVLIATCLSASFTQPDWRRYYATASPWLSMLVAGALFLPHVVWALDHHAPPVAYALSKTGLGAYDTLRNTISFLSEVTAFHVLVLAIVIGCWWRRPAVTVAATGMMPREQRRMVAALALFPAVWTAFFGIVLELQTGGNMTIAMFPLVPLWLLTMFPAADAKQVFRLGAWVSGAIAGAALLASPAVAYLTFTRTKGDPDWVLPQQEVAHAATQIWHRETGAPLRFVGGSIYFGSPAAFYSDERPSGFVHLSYPLAPWVTPEAIHRDGLLAICASNDAACDNAASALGGDDVRRIELTLQHRLWGAERAPATVNLFIFPPHPGG